MSTGEPDATETGTSGSGRGRRKRSSNPEPPRRRPTSPHVRFGGRTRETDPGQPGHRARVRPNSGRLTSEQRTKDRYRIRGYLSTAAKHGYNMIDALRDAVLGRPWIPPDPTPA